MSHARRLSLFYQRIPSWDAGIKLARPSKRHTCKNGVVDLKNSCCYHTLGMRCHLGSNPLPLLKKHKNYAYFERNARQNT